jgi:Concanavalin A-like lectin/glucanases superfamily
MTSALSGTRRILMCLAAGLLLQPVFGGPANAAGTDFVTAVTSTNPIAYYRLNTVEGKSVVGSTRYRSLGGISLSGPGAPIGPGSQFVKLDGNDGYIVSTQSGGINGAGSMMAWVNLAALPSDISHIFYLMGESQNGNDFDLQFETDNQLKFYTAAGGHLTYVPLRDKLLNRWHMVIATLDTASRTRVIYWDGRAVATDKGSGAPNKSGIFSIGESTVFRGRFFKGGIQEVALWDRALRADEVASIYAAAHPGDLAAAGEYGNSPNERDTQARGASGGGPIATNAKVEIEDSSGPVRLKSEEKIAIMFLTAIQSIELDCQMRVKHACAMDELLVGPVATDGARLAHLKFDPATDPNYTYTLSASGMAWEAHANPRRPGLAGFYFLAKMMAGPDATYNAGGAASAIDKQLTSRSIEGDSFAVR